MEDKTQRCAQCRGKFSIPANEIDFYARLRLPAPTRCRECRVQRRMSWKDDRTFAIRKSDFSGKQIISIYPPGTPFPVYHPSEWYGDLWDPMKYGRPIDFSRPFFEQWHELMLAVPRLGIDIVNCQNSDYCNYCGDDKNCYLDIAGEANEECFYDLFTKFSRNCVDCTFVYNSELCYEAINCYRCYNVRHSMYVEDSRDCSFCFDLKGCSDCLFSSNLRQQKYCIENRQLTRAEYLREVESLELDSCSGQARAAARWREQVIGSAIHRDMYSINSENCTGSDIKSSRNCSHAFNVSDCEDSNYLYDVLDAKDCCDLNYSLYNPECSCELISTLSMKYSAYSMASHYCSEVFYCDLCNNSSSLFGCIGLNRKECCILNQQYTPEEYAELKERLISHMQSTGEWGEFFPGALSPFGYNETVAQEYYPLTPDKARDGGYSWREPVERGKWDGPETSIPDKITDVDDSIVQKVLTCAAGGQRYKVIKPELKFYRDMSLPLPTRAPEQRHRDRLAMRNLRTLWQRTCDSCSQPITTSYPPKSPYVVYCEGCYLKAVHS